MKFPMRFAVIVRFAITQLLHATFPITERLAWSHHDPNAIP